MIRIRSSLIPVAALLLVIILLVANLPTGNAAASSNLILVPAADAYVNSTYPNNNFGTATILRTDNVPVVNSYLRFTVSGLAGRPILSARLAIRPNSSSSKGVTLRTVSNNSWGETSITYNNAPAMGTTLASVPAVTGGVWVYFDVSAYVKSAATYSFGLVTPGETNISIGSREAGANSPTLTLTVGTAATSTATSILKATSTPTATMVVNSTATSTAVSQASATPTATALVIPTAIPTSASADPVLVGAGDIATCSGSGDDATANLLDSLAGTVITLGDNAYDSGTSTEFANCYNPTWGRDKSRTKPAAGNHDYVTSGAAGYFSYFGAAAGDPARGYYSYNLGAWHIIVLNSEINNAAGSPQETWLRQDLAANPAACTLAYWHKPLFSSGSTHGSNPGMKALWQALSDYHADVVLNGHEHNYERFAPQTADGVASATGMREFVVGTGGKSHYPFGTILANSQVRNSDTYGVIKFSLHANNYDWQFIPVAGATFSDSGSATCNP